MWLFCHFSFAVSLLLLLNGCTRSVEIPAIPGPSPQPLNGIILRDSLRAKDLREIFRALNAKGQFESLKPWLESPSDADLQDFLNWFNETIFDESLSRYSFIGILKSRSSRKGFQEWYELLSHTNPQVLTATKLLFNDSDFNPLSQRLSPLLDLKLWNLKQTLALRSEKEFSSFGIHSSIPENEKPGTLAIARELGKLLGQSRSSDLLKHTFRSIDEHDSMSSLWLGLSQLNFKSRSGAPFVAMMEFLSSHLVINDSKKGETQRLFHLMKTLHQPSNGLFAGLEKGIRDTPSVAKILGDKLRPQVIGGIASAIQWELEADEQIKTKAFWLTPHSGSFQRLVNAIRTGFASMDGLIEQTSASPNVLRLGRTLNSIAMAKWLLSISEQNRPAMAQLPENNFLEGFWKLIPQSNEFTLRILETTEDPTITRKVSAWAEEALTSSGEGELLTVLRAFAKDPTYGAEPYSFSPNSDLTLHVKLRESIQMLDQIHSLGSLSALAISAIRSAAGMTKPSLLKLSDFETAEGDTMLDGVNRLVSGLSYPKVEKLLDLLLDNWSLADLAISDRELIMNLLPERSEQAKLLGDILVELPVLQSLRARKIPLPSFLQVYHGLLQNFRPAQQRGFHDLLAAIEPLHIFEIAQGKPEFPAIFQAFQDPLPMAKMLHLVGVATTAERNQLVHLFEDCFETEKGWSMILDALTRLHQRNPPAFEAMLSNLMAQGWDILPSETQVTKTEREWTQKFIKTGQLEAIRGFLLKHDRGSAGLKLVKELQRLSSQSILTQGFQALSRVQSDRMKNIAATLLEMDKSGELQALLKTLEVLIGS